jgi:xanthine/uracil permease
VLKIGVVEITSTAVAMILGIILNLILNPEKEAKMEKYDV